jgi:large subunit ribosomal protein L22
MQAVAVMKHARISPQKARLVADQVRSLPVDGPCNSEVQQ